MLRPEAEPWIQLRVRSVGDGAHRDIMFGQERIGQPAGEFGTLLRRDGYDGCCRAEPKDRPARAA